MALSSIEPANEFLHHIPRHAFHWTLEVALKVAGIGTHNVQPLGLCDFILAEIKWLANDDPVYRPLISLVVVRPHHELAGWNEHKLHTNAVTHGG
jgi:hypothetical protein